MIRFTGQLTTAMPPKRAYAVLADMSNLDQCNPTWNVAEGTERRRQTLGGLRR